MGVLVWWEMSEIICLILSFSTVTFCAERVQEER